MTNVQGPKKHRRHVISLEEFEEALDSAKAVDTDPYYALRDQAILCILWLTGKRAQEVAQLELEDVLVSDGYLQITFTVCKKRNAPARDLRRRKAISIDETYVEPIIKYHRYMQRKHPECMYLFPSTTYSNLTEEVILNSENHLDRTTVWRRVVLHGPETWAHLYRETQGARVVRAQNNSIAAVFSVKERLDLKQMETAMRYVQRYGMDIIEETK